MPAHAREQLTYSDFCVFLPSARLLLTNSLLPARVADTLDDVVLSIRREGELYALSSVLDTESERNASLLTVLLRVLVSTLLRRAVPDVSWQDIIEIRAMEEDIVIRISGLTGQTIIKLLQGRIFG